jgi:8-oxo-dGTP diphosphatase
MQKIIIASGPVIVEENKVLLNQHGDTNFWKFCGGKTKENESLEETAIRRVKEEMGIEIKIINDVPFFTYTKKETTDGKVDVILVHFLAKRIGEIKPSEEIREWDWFDINNLPENLAPNILPTLKHFGFIN